MSTPRLLAARYAGGLVVAAALLAVVRSAVQPRLPAATGIGLGAGLGLTLFCVVERRLPPLPRPRGRPLRVWGGKHLALGIWAGVEEAAWRHGALGVLAGPLGGPVALALSSAGFAAAHRPPSRYHVLTGGLFGAVYLASGRFAAAWAAHAGYNAAVALTAEARQRRPAGLEA